MRIAALMALLASMASADAGQFTIEWDNTNASPAAAVYVSPWPFSQPAAARTEVATNRFTVTNVPPGVYSVRVTAISTNGIESDPAALDAVMPAMMIRLSIVQDTVTASIFSAPEITGPFILISNVAVKLRTNLPRSFVRARLTGPPLTPPLP
jgi:hypothetical protein